MLNSKQLTTIIINAITVKMLITFPHNIIGMCGNAAWISAIYCTLIAAVLFCITRTIYKTHNNVIEIAEKAGGNVLRIITGIIVFIVLGANFFTMVRIFPEIIRLVLLQRTYIELIGILFMVCIILGAYCGIEAIGRIHELFIPIAGGIFVIFILLLIPAFKLENIFPIMGKGMYNLFVKNISFLSVFSDLLLLNILIPYTKNAEEYKKTGTKAVFIGGACAVVILAAYCLSYVYPASEKFIIPIYQLERLIWFGSFFSRFEAAFQFIWSISILIYGSLYMAVLAKVWQRTFRLKKSEPILMAIGAVMVGAATIPGSLVGIIGWEGIINKWIYIPAFALPVIFGIVGRIKKIR